MKLSLLRQQRGQGMTEYIIVVALIAVAAIGVYQFFGQTIRSQTAGIAAEVSGQKAETHITAAKDAANEGFSEGNRVKGLAEYYTPDAQ